MDISPTIYDETRPLETKRQAAHRLGCTIRTVDDLMKRGRLTPIRLNSRVIRFRPEAIDFLVEERKANA